MHTNTLTAHRKVRGELAERNRRILDYLDYLGSGWRLTDREIKDGIGLDDMNSVRPRITELIRDGFAVECGKARCQVTGQTVRLVRATTEAERNRAEQGELF